MAISYNSKTRPEVQICFLKSPFSKFLSALLDFTKSSAAYCSIEMAESLIYSQNRSVGKAPWELRMRNEETKI